MIVIPTKPSVPTPPTNEQRYSAFLLKLAARPTWNGHPWKWCVR